MKHLNIAIFGLSITSSWGNGHATTYRSLIKALKRRGHTTTFYERDMSWYAQHRDMPEPSFCDVVLYRALEQLSARRSELERADLIIVGSFVPEAEALTKMLASLSPPCLAFYDIDTPVTVARLKRREFDYLHPRMIPSFDLYLSFSGGPILEILSEEYGAARARPLYCSVDPELYAPGEAAGELQEEPEYLLGYLGTYSSDRQPTLEQMLIRPAEVMRSARFCVAGAQYPTTIEWPENVRRIEHIPPQQHRRFYNQQKFTLNVTRGDMIDAGFSPSVRLFEAGACGTPVVTDDWFGLDSFFTPGEEILVAQSTQDVLDYFKMSDAERSRLGQRFRQRVMRSHTSTHRALELEQYWQEVTGRFSQYSGPLHAHS